jgi:quercetin dioxygenase-like cupin family protein
MTETLTLTPHEHVTILEERPERLVVEVRYAASPDRPPLHLHPEQDERFEVLDGALHVAVEGTERVLGPGETLDVPRGTAHRMWAPEGEVRARWETAPAGRTGEWFRRLDALHREGRVGRNGMPGPLAFATLLTEYRDVFRLSAGPQLLVRGALAALAPIGRMRGY